MIHLFDSFMNSSASGVIASLASSASALLICSTGRDFISLEMSAFAFASFDVSDGGDLVLLPLGIGAAFSIMFRA